MALVQESFYVGLNKNETSDEAPSLAKSLIMDYNDILVNTGLMIDEAQVDLLASQITRARTVYILGTYKTKVVGMELERRLATLGIISKFVSDQSSSRILAQYARDRDVAIFISDSIFSKRVYSLSETLKRRGCFTAGITNNDSTKVTTLLGARIVVADKIMSKYNLSIANNIAYFFAIDLIITKILQGDKDYKFRQIESENILSSLEAIDGNMIDNY